MMTVSCSDLEYLEIWFKEKSVQSMVNFGLAAERLPLQMVTGQDRVFVAPSELEPLPHR